MEEKRIFDCKDESEVEDFLDKNKTLVSHESYCNIINSFFFHNFDVEIFFRNRNRLTFSNKISYNLYRPKDVHVSADLIQLNKNYDTVMKYNVVVNTSNLLDSWDIKPTMFKFLDHLLVSPPEIIPTFSSWVLKTSYKHEALKFLAKNDIKLSYYPVTSSTFSSLSKLDKDDCRIFVSLLEDKDSYMPQLQKLSNFQSLRSIKESADINYKEYDSYEWIFDDHFIKIFNDSRSGRCIGNHKTNLQFRLINVVKSDNVRLVCSTCIDNINDFSMMEKRDRLLAYYNISNLNLTGVDEEKFVLENMALFIKNVKFLDTIFSPSDLKLFKEVIYKEKYFPDETKFIFKMMKEAVSLCHTLINHYSL